jgi:hypothetical protein
MSLCRLTVGAAFATSTSLVSYAADHSLSMCRPAHPKASGPPPTRWSSIRCACSEPDLIEFCIANGNNSLPSPSPRPSPPAGARATKEAAPTLSRKNLPQKAPVGERIQVRGQTCNRSMAYAKLHKALHGWNEVKCCAILRKRDRSHCGILRHGIGLLQLPGAETRQQAGSMNLKLGWTRQNLGRQTGGQT